MLASTPAELLMSWVMPLLKYSWWLDVSVHLVLSTPNSPSLACL